MSLAVAVERALLAAPDRTVLRIVPDDLITADVDGAPWRCVSAAELYASAVSLAAELRPLIAHAFVASAASSTVLPRPMADDAHPGKPLIGIYGATSEAYVAAVVGVGLAGGACVPLDASWPDGRLGAIVRDARLDAVVVVSPHRNHSDVDVWRRADVHKSRVVSFPSSSLRRDAVSHDDARRLDSRTSSAVDAASDVRDVSYVLYTSGSSGSPKGVLGTSVGIIGRTQWWADTFPHAADDVGYVSGAHSLRVFISLL